MTSPIFYDSNRRKWPALEELRELGRYNYLIFQLIRRNLLTRYKRSVLGIAWAMLNPLGTMIVISVVFANAFKVGKEFAPYILSGLVAWTFFSQSTTSAIGHLIWGEGLIRRIYLPRTSFAISALGVGIVNLLLSLIPLLLVMWVTGVEIRWTIVFLPIAIFLLASFTLGMALIISTVAVYFADIAEIYQVLLLAWMYLSPILYPEEYLTTFPAGVMLVAKLNPMYHLIKIFRLPLYYGTLPELNSILLAAGIAGLTFLIGWLLFTSKADEMAYRL